MENVKRKLSFLATIALVSGCSSTLIGCGNINQTNQSNNLDQLIEVKDLGFIKYDIKSDNQTQLEDKVVEAINEKNPGLKLTNSNLDYDLVYKNKTGNFWQMNLTANKANKSFKGHTTVEFSMITPISLLTDDKTLNLGEFDKTKKSDFIIWEPHNYVMRSGDVVSNLFKKIPELKIFVKSDDISVATPIWDNAKRLGTTTLTIPSHYLGIMNIEYTVKN